MPRFFVEDMNISDLIFRLDEESSRHISKSLRMSVGDSVVICDGRQKDYNCKIVKIERTAVFLKAESCKPTISEPTIDVHLFQAIPKLDRLEYIIQKSVELGVKSVTPVLTRRCIPRVDFKNFDGKLQRFNKISKQAAMQSGRGIVPKVNFPVKFIDAIEKMKEFEFNVLFYEYGSKKLNSMEMCKCKDIGFMVGSEGGFDFEEVEFSRKKGINIANLGRRILRCETAPVCILSIMMYATNNF